MISKYRPQMPIIGCTTQMPTYRHLSMSWGVVPVLCGEQNTEDGLFKHAMARSKECGVVQDGDLVVITAGVPAGYPGHYQPAQGADGGGCYSARNRYR